MIVTLAQYKTYAGITGTDDDAQLTVILEGASDLIARACHRRFEFGSYFETVNIDFEFIDTVEVRNPPIVSIIALTDNNTLLASSKFEVFKDEGVITLKENINTPRYHHDVGPYFTKGVGIVQIGYFGGFQDMPASLQLLVNMFTNRIFDRVGRESIVSESIGDYSYKLSDLGSQDPEDVFNSQELLIFRMFTKMT
jgi:hypothetical protein